jgi:hypothetical protein
MTTPLTQEQVEDVLRVATHAIDTLAVESTTTRIRSSANEALVAKLREQLPDMPQDKFDALVVEAKRIGREHQS